MLLLLVFGGAAVGAALAPHASPLDGARQALVVITDDWQAVPGTLRRFERTSAAEPWVQVGDSIPVVVGHAGLGWGIGLHGRPPALPGPVKHEGDGRAPAGVFRLGFAFGYGRRPAWIKLPYLRATASLQCVDDTTSTHYNEVLDRRNVRVDWNSHEDMRRRDDAYRFGVIVEHDWGAHRQPAAGSCIFLHIWGGPRSATVGCTAMASENLRTVLSWLDPGRTPVLVQIPREQYRQLRADWRLP